MKGRSAFSRAFVGRPARPPVVASLIGSGGGDRGQSFPVGEDGKISFGSDPFGKLGLRDEFIKGIEKEREKRGGFLSKELQENKTPRSLKPGAEEELPGAEEMIQKLERDARILKAALQRTGTYTRRERFQIFQEYSFILRQIDSLSAQEGIEGSGAQAGSLADFGGRET